MRKTFLSAIILLSVVSVAQTQEKTGGTAAFTLQQAIDYAYNNNTAYQNALIDEQTAQFKVKEILGLGLPQVKGSVDVKNFIEIPTQVALASAFNPAAPPDALAAFRFGLQYTASAGVEASQLLFSSAYLYGVKASKVYNELFKKAAQRSKIETATAVTKAYYNVLVNNERMALLDANVARLKKLADDTKALNNNGFVEKIDVDRVTIAYNNLLVEQEKIKRLLELGIVLLKYQIGMPQNNTLTLTEKLSSIEFQSEKMGTEKAGYANRVEYSLLESQLYGSKLQLKNNQWEYAPTLVAYGAASYNGFGTKFDFLSSQQNWYPSVLIGATLNVPIFDGFQKHNKIQQSRLAVKKAENDLKFVQQSIELDQESSRINLLNATASLDNQKKNIALAEEVVRVTKLKYDQGVGSNLEVLSAETDLKEAQTNYFNALFDALIAKVDYQKSIGALVK